MNIRKSEIIELRVNFPQGYDHRDIKKRMTTSVGIANRVDTAESEMCFIARFKYQKSAQKAAEKISGILNESSVRTDIDMKTIK